ncbi:MAG: SCO family protein [Candidatus Poseidoniaceae archaeon]
MDVEPRPIRLLPVYIVVACLMSVALIGSPVSAYNGIQLNSSSVDNFTLVDQNNSEFKFSDATEEIVIVSFFFTRCPDVCPVITQNLKLVHDTLPAELEDKVEFVSITLDPKYDTPDVLTQYMEFHGVDWPHLTGPTDDVKDVWGLFAIYTQEYVIDSHDDNVSDMEGQVHNSSVMYVKPDGTAEELMFLPTGMTLTSTAASEAGWTVNSSDSQFGTMINGFNGYNSPEDWSWWWSLKLFDEETQTWEDSPVGVDSVNALEHEHLAWYATHANASLLEPPLGDTPSVQIVYPDNTTNSTNVSSFTGYHLTQGAFDGAGIDVDIQDGSYGHFLNSIDGVAAPSDWSWWWQLHVWNETSNGWDDAELGMDLIDEPMTLAWASNNTSHDAIPDPGFAFVEETECNGHGWVMGSGSSAHCMCDAGYEWAETDMLTCIPVESEPEYTVGHFAYTYILNEEKEPRVRYVDDSWLASDFVEDVVKLAEKEGVIKDDSEGIPSVGFLVSVAVVSMAAISLRSKSE